MTAIGDLGAGLLRGRGAGIARAAGGGGLGAGGEAEGQGDAEEGGEAGGAHAGAVLQVGSTASGRRPRLCSWSVSGCIKIV